jgi:hypothetical protein
MSKNFPSVGMNLMALILPYPSFFGDRFEICPLVIKCDILPAARGGQKNFPGPEGLAAITIFHGTRQAVKKRGGTAPCFFKGA